MEAIKNMSFEELAKWIDYAIKNSDWSKEHLSNWSLMHKIANTIDKLLGDLTYSTLYTTIERNTILVRVTNYNYAYFTIKVTRKKSGSDWSSWHYEQMYSYSGVSIECIDNFKNIQELLNYAKKRLQEKELAKERKMEDFRNMLYTNKLDLKTFYKIRNLYESLNWEQRNSLEQEAREE